MFVYLSSEESSDEPSTTHADEVTHGTRCSVCPQPLVEPPLSESSGPKSILKQKPTDRKNRSSSDSSSGKLNRTQSDTTAASTFASDEVAIVTGSSSELHKKSLSGAVMDDKVPVMEGDRQSSDGVSGVPAFSKQHKIVVAKLLNLV